MIRANIWKKITSVYFLFSIFKQRDANTNKIFTWIHSQMSISWPCFIKKLFWWACHITYPIHLLSPNTTISTRSLQAKTIKSATLDLKHSPLRTVWDLLCVPCWHRKVWVDYYSSTGGGNDQAEPDFSFTTQATLHQSLLTNGESQQDFHFFTFADLPEHDECRALLCFSHNVATVSNE